jgi:multidrug efflux pump subunit AcrB
VARLITPMMAAYLMRDTKHHDYKDGFIMRGYKWLLFWSVRWRWLTLAAGIAFFFGSIMVIQTLPSGFIPKEDVARITANIELPPGTKLEQTRDTTDLASKAVRQLDGVKQVYVIGGASATGVVEPRRATLIIELVHKTERERSQAELEVEILNVLADIPDIRAFYVNDRGERQLAIGVMGQDGMEVSDNARKIQSEMALSGKFQGLSSNAALDRPELIVEPKIDRLAELGLTTASLSEALRVATIGDIDANLAKFTLGDRQIPIRVQLTEDAREDLGTIESLSIPLPAGGSVPLSSIADIRFDQGPSTIDRFNRERRVVVGTDMINGAEIGEGLEIVRNLQAVKDLPPTVRIQETGDAEVMGEVFASFAQAMVMGLMLVFVVLILLFGSAFHAITILMSLPLSLGGVVAGLWLTNNAVSMPVVIGILMLMGIVTKNAIMLVDFAIERVKHGANRFDAIMDAGAKRARPIVMTTIAMSAGMIPAALAIGDGGEFRAPMAIAVVGGLLVSTVLSLVFVPAVYTIMDDVSRGVSWLWHKILRPNKPDEPEDALIEYGEYGHPVLASPQGKKIAKPPLQIAAE